MKKTRKIGEGKDLSRGVDQGRKSQHCGLLIFRFLHFITYLTVFPLPRFPFFLPSSTRYMALSISPLYWGYQKGRSKQAANSHAEEWGLEGTGFHIILQSSMGLLETRVMGVFFLRETFWIMTLFIADLHGIFHGIFHDTFMIMHDHASSWCKEKLHYTQLK